MTVAEARKKGREQLTSSPSAQLDTDCLLMFLLDCDKTSIMFHQEKELSQEQQEQFEAYLRARQTGLPIAYITGSKEFYGLNFYVTPDVLIPKPDTELLVEKALEIIEQKTQSNPRNILTICDMCTGSGCVGITILQQCIEQKIVKRETLPFLMMADISDKALKIAKENADKILGNYKSNITLQRTNLFEAIGARTFDLIVSNPPYIPCDEAKELLTDGRSEPILALNGDIDLFGNDTHENDGLGIMRNLVPQAYSHLSPKGVLIVEAGEYNAEMTEYIFRKNSFVNTRIFKDLNGDLRDIQGEKK